MQQTDRQRFSSHFGTILTMIGVAVGLGNVWRFPYMMGKYGGSAFLIIYLLFTLMFAIPAVMSEWALGRETRKGPFGAFTTAFNPAVGRMIGALLMITVLVANSYYLVVIANVIFSAWHSASSGFQGESFSQYTTGLNNGLLQYAIAITTLAISLSVIYRGLNRGIEMISRIFVPFFLISICYLIVNAFMLPGAFDHLLAFLQPDFGALQASHIFAALGQAFFSLSLGGTFLLIYGSYLQKDENLVRSAIWVGAGDTGAAILASLFVVPTVLVFGLDMTAGPQLIFSTLPNLFAQMPAGRFLGTLFLVALAMVAFLSNIAALEVLVGGLPDIGSLRWQRSKIILAVGLLEALLIFPSAMDANLIGILDLIFGSGMQVLGSALAMIALAWGLGRDKTIRQIFGAVEHGRAGLLFFWIRWVIPAVLFVILASYLYTIIS